MVEFRLEFRLDFLALIRIDQILTSPSLVDIPPVFVFVQSLRQATKNGHRVFLWVPQQFLMLCVLPKVSSLSFRIR